jgi:ArsR family transcriptional regulator
VLDIASGDGVLAELLAPHARRYVCIDASPRVVTAASERLKPFANVEVRQGDMHALPFPDASFDLVVLMHALTYAGQALRRRWPKPRASCAAAGACCCRAWRATNTRQWWRPTATPTWVSRKRNCAASPKRRGWTIANAGSVTRERRPPHFEVLSLLGVKP